MEIFITFDIFGIFPKTLFSAIFKKIAQSIAALIQLCGSYQGNAFSKMVAEENCLQPESARILCPYFYKIVVIHQSRKSNIVSSALYIFSIETLTKETMGK